MHRHWASVVAAQAANSVCEGLEEHVVHCEHVGFLSPELAT